jgi:UDP-N-acetylglucosamine pyrophosphorylase
VPQASVDFPFPASVDERILKHMVDTEAEFIMEVTDKTKADVKVGIPLTPIR